MMRDFRRLPPLLRALWLLGLLFLLAGVGTWVWGVLWDHQDLFARQGRDLAWAFLLLALACNWPGVAYNARFLRSGRALPWLDTWRGQLAAAVGVAVLPLGFVAVALLIPPNSPLSVLTFLLTVLVLVVAYVSLDAGGRVPR
jgi:hypothetical protein